MVRRDGGRTGRRDEGDSPGGGVRSRYRGPLPDPDRRVRPRRRPRVRDRVAGRPPARVRVSRPHADTVFSGTITVDGVTRRLLAAPGLQAHLWGTRHVEELCWLYCPAFAEDPSARLEAASARLDRKIAGGIPGPWLTPVAWRSAGGDVASTGLVASLRNRLAMSGPAALELRAASGSITARAWCAPESLVGYVYRDPDGRELHVAQSDVA